MADNNMHWIAPSDLANRPGKETSVSRVVTTVEFW
jgi:hypothetical protein